MFPLRIDRGKRTKWRRISIKTIKVKPSAAKCHPNRPKWAPDAFKIRPKCSQTQSKTERSLEEREKKKKRQLHHQTETIKSVLIEREVENQIKTNWERNCWGEKGKDKKEKKEKKEKRERETITNDGLNKQQ